jgi:hypothetical protein
VEAPQKCILSGEAPEPGFGGDFVGYFQQQKEEYVLSEELFKSNKHRF